MNSDILATMYDTINKLFDSGFKAANVNIFMSYDVKNIVVGQYKTVSHFIDIVTGKAFLFGYPVNFVKGKDIFYIGVKIGE